MKKPPKKVANNPAQTLFFLYWPGCLNGPKTEIPYHQKSFNAGLGILTGYRIQNTEYRLLFYSYFPWFKQLFRDKNC